MAERAAKMQVLVVQFWIHDAKPIRAALERAGLDVAITRVDFEPALHAALTLDRYDLVIYDPATTTMSKQLVAETMRAARHPDVALVVADDLSTLGARACEVIRSRAC
jgi:23S rRNA U2552 (ribose-2'-O)-methylase RlmE/FtsJ